MHPPQPWQVVRSGTFAVEVGVGHSDAALDTFRCLEDGNASAIEGIAYSGGFGYLA